MDYGLDTDAEEREPKPIAALLGQLANDTRTFAKAEIGYLRAEAGERIDVAVPGLAMIGAAAAIGLGTVVALLIGIIMVLSPSIGVPGSVLVSILIGVLVSWIFWKSGTARLRAAFSMKDKR